MLIEFDLYKFDSFLLELSIPMNLFKETDSVGLHQNMA